MKNLTFIILLLFTILGCSEKGKSEIEKFTFFSSPSFYGSFKIETDNNSKKVIASIPYEYSLADSISKNTWRFIDSTDLVSVRKFLPKEIKFEVQVENSKFNELKSVLEKLSKFKSDKFPPNDGITINLEIENEQKVKSNKTFFSPNRNSEEGKLIIKTYEIVAELFKDETKLEDAIENSQRYFSDEIFIVKSTNPLYVKFLNDNCDELEYKINALPKAEKIFVDLTNFSKDKNDCLEKTLRKRYSKIKWILKINENYGFAEE
ncbi:hypothetical protein SAMN05444372_11923 [Flavobacterium micromati]|uniref:Lipoprotein n=1 Tax=Flavobacterium micromati TaxID=229205 RepID=A0A1M5QT97_9FLAO|nr:hypothetical protein [Flavobacterium micromati]SHH17096.1 hypothetical protein SAMN05444372_11923 [Flavobacterium micromati]